METKQNQLPIKILLHFFTYAGDADILPVSIAAARHAFPGAPVHVIDDSGAPMQPHQVAALGDIHYSRSDWERKYNLNGPECVRGILQTMNDNAKRYSADYVIKIDPDTLVLRSERHLGWIRENVGHFTQTTPEKFFGGMFYGIRKDILDICCQNAMAMTLPEGANEDNTIGCLANIASHTGKWVVENGTDPSGEGRIGGYNFKFIADNGGVVFEYIDKIIEDLDVINIGTHHKQGLPAWARNLVANALWQRFLLSLRQKAESENKPEETTEQASEPPPEQAPENTDSKEETPARDEDSSPTT